MTIIRINEGFARLFRIARGMQVTRLGAHGALRISHLLPGPKKKVPLSGARGFAGTEFNTSPNC